MPARLLPAFLAALLAAGCANQPIQENTYFGGVQTDSATVKAVGKNGWQTISGDPYVVGEDDVTNASLMPYGGGARGIRAAEDGFYGD